MATTTSPKSSFAKLGLYSKPKTFKVMVLGQSGVGKSALVVRFITRRFIGEYDSRLEKVYAFQTVIDNEIVYFEILDSAGDLNDNVLEVPVVLVGNKVDLSEDRMVTTEEGQRRSKEIGCVCFHEISVRESIEQVESVLRDARRFWRVSSKSPRVRAADADVHPAALSRSLSRVTTTVTTETTTETFEPGQSWTEENKNEDDENLAVLRSDSTSSSGQEGVVEGGEVGFRARASTDSRLPPRPARPRHPPASRAPPLTARRMSVSMRGTNTCTY